MALISLKGGQETFPVTDGINFTSTIVNMWYNDVTNTIQLIDEAGVVVANVGSTYVVEAAVVQADFATAAYVAYPIGTIVATVSYTANASPEPGAFVKTDTANGDFNDWICISSQALAADQSIGELPQA